MFRFVLISLLALAQPAICETRVPASQLEIQLGFAPLVKQAAPAVVNIYAKRIVQAQSRSPFAGDPFFEDFFGGFGNSAPRVQNSLGSGVILTGDGIVVSNYHVVGGASDIRVVLNDRREYSASVMLADKASDLAILKLKYSKDLPFLPLRASNTVEVGELALAIGNPFGIGQTVTSGIVSGLARSGMAAGTGRGYFLQTDAAINPGNSGGALVDMNGELIGINTRIVSRSGGSNGIGFAIPSDLVAQFMVQARAGNATFIRPWAGMNAQPVDASIAASLGLVSASGILISDLHSDSPFLAAGFAIGDVITAVDGAEINSIAGMIYRMSVLGVGASAVFTRLRDGERQDVRVTLMAPPGEPALGLLSFEKDSALAGLELVNINPIVLAEFGLPLGASGVVIVKAGPVGARLGLRRGDILWAINGQALTETADVMPAFAKDLRWLTIEIQRGQQRQTLRIRR